MVFLSFFLAHLWTFYVNFLIRFITRICRIIVPYFVERKVFLLFLNQRTFCFLNLCLLICFLEDPVRVFDYKPQPPNSVLKLFHDLFSDSKTSELLYTNDAKVLIDVIIRHLTNLSQGDKVKTYCTYFTFCHHYLWSCTLVSRKVWDCVNSLKFTLWLMIAPGLGEIINDVITSSEARTKLDSITWGRQMVSQEI